MNVKIGDLVYSNLGNLGLVKKRIEAWHNIFGDIAYQIEWVNGSEYRETVHESTVESWRELYLLKFELNKHMVDFDIHP